MSGETVETLYREGVKTGRLLVLQVHPWSIGQPFRTGYLDRGAAPERAPAGGVGRHRRRDHRLVPARSPGLTGAAMKLGTSVRFVFPTSPATHERFRSLLASMPKGAFIERPMGAYSPAEQARNLMEVAAAARAAGLDALLTGDSHAATPAYAATFSRCPPSRG